MELAVHPLFAPTEILGHVAAPDKDERFYCFNRRRGRSQRRRNCKLPLGTQSSATQNVRLPFNQQLTWRVWQHVAQDAGRLERESSSLIADTKGDGLLSQLKHTRNINEKNQLHLLWVLKKNAK